MVDGDDSGSEAEDPGETPGDERSQVVGDVRYEYSADWLTDLESRDQWDLYWRQLRLIRDHVAPPGSVLEIGPGRGVTSAVLGSMGFDVTTMDIDDRKDPDVVANVVSHDFPGSYDHVLAFEVFEHIPLAEVRAVAGRIREACDGHLFVSVPDARRTFLRVSVHAPRVAWLDDRELTLRRAKGPGMSEHHFWELGKGASVEDIVEMFGAVGFELVETFPRVSHRFFAFR